MLVVFYRYFDKWSKSNRTNARFISNNADWLNTRLDFPDIVYTFFPSTSGIFFS